MVPRRCERNPRNSRNTGQGRAAQGVLVETASISVASLVMSSHVADGPPPEKDLGIGKSIQGRMEASQRGKSVVGEIRCLAWLHTISEILVLQG